MFSRIFNAHRNAVWKPLACEYIINVYTACLIAKFLKAFISYKAPDIYTRNNKKEYATKERGKKREKKLRS